MEIKKKSSFGRTGNPRPSKLYRPDKLGKSPYSKKKQLEYKKTNPDKEERTRLNKYIANAGICSRREADEYIRAGLVRVNGVVITGMGYKVSPGDEVRFHDNILKQEKKVYILLNKPKDYITTTDDPHAKQTVMDLIKGACRERVYPVGRLDRNTTGVLLLTNDGEIAKKLTHPKYNKKKIYHVFLDKNISMSDLLKIADGVDTEAGFANADNASYVDESDKKQVGVEIHTGQNHVVKLMFEAIGYKVTKLDRVYFAGLTKKSLQRGEWRFLTEKEINMLRLGAYS
ncbi:MAG: rRNA pseudouridine synthase [Bacteroidia bacterium]|nr:rRNA pseudouridine synthase [Bacteroidia bacterium]